MVQHLSIFPLQQKVQIKSPRKLEIEREVLFDLVWSDISQLVNFCDAED